MRYHGRMRSALVMILSCALVMSGCATAAGGRISAAPPGGEPAAAIAEFVQKLAPGTTIRVDRVTGRSVRGALLKATPEAIVVQPRTRLPEPPVEIRIADIVRVLPEANGGRSLGKAIGAGAAAGAGAALGVFLVLLAIFSD